METGFVCNIRGSEMNSSPKNVCVFFKPYRTAFCAFYETGFA